MCQFENLKMTKHFFKISFYSFVTFCVFNFTFLLIQIYFRLKIKEIPEINIGFPFNFYSIFWLDRNDLHHGADLKKFIFNLIIFWLIVFLFYLLKTKNFNLTTKHKQQK